MLLFRSCRKVIVPSDFFAFELSKQFLSFMLLYSKCIVHAETHPLSLTVKMVAQPRSEGTRNVLWEVLRGKMSFCEGKSKNLPKMADFLSLYSD